MRNIFFFNYMYLFVSPGLNAPSTQKDYSTPVSEYGVCVLCLSLDGLYVICEASEDDLLPTFVLQMSLS